MRRPSFLWLSPTLTSVGKRLGIDAHYFAKNSAIITFSHGISTVKGIVTGYLVTRLFPQELYGEYRFILNVLGMLGVVGLAGFPSALAIAIARKQYIEWHSLMKKYSVIVSIGSILLLGAIPLLGIWNKQEIWPLFLIAAFLFVPSAIGTSMFGGIVRGAGTFGLSLKANIVSNTLLITSVLLMLLLQPSSVLLLALTMGIPAIVYLGHLKRLISRYKATEAEQSIIKPAVDLSLATIPTTASWYVDGLLISALFGLDQLAVFSVALLIPEQLKIFFKELFPVLFSRLASGKDTADKRRKMHIGVLMGTMGFLGIISIYALAAPILMRILFPEYPTEQLASLSTVAMATLIVTPGTAYPQYLEARGMIKAIHLSNWISSVILVISLLLLVPTWGLMGAVVARGLFRLSYLCTGLAILLNTPTEAT